MLCGSATNGSDPSSRLDSGPIPSCLRNLSPIPGTQTPYPPAPFSETGLVLYPLELLDIFGRDAGKPAVVLKSRRG